MGALSGPPVEVESWLRNWTFGTCRPPPVMGPPRICPRPVRVDTWPLRPRACGLYESEGDVPIGNLNGNPVAMLFGEKRLSG